VNRAGTDDDEQTTLGVGVVDDGDAFFAAGEDGAFGLGGLGDFVLEEVRWGEGVVAADCSGWLDGRMR
jgi:hypothetical protein